MLRIVLTCASALVVCPSLLAGDLNPPPGPVAPTMKTLDVVEPSTAIESLPGSATAQHVITEPGAYHLTGNMDLTAIGATAIRVQVSGVTIDLRGFTIIGDNDETLPAIRGSALTTIRNGTIDNWGGKAIEAFGHTVVADMTFDFVTGGTTLDLNGSAIVRDCLFRGCAPLEFSGETLLSGCVFRDMGEAVASPGARAVSIVDCVFDGQNAGNTGAVIVLGEDAKLQNVNVSNDGRSGLVAGLRATVIGCTFSGNNDGSNDGVTVGTASIVKDCIISDYGGDGLVGSFSCVFEGNTLVSNSGNGIECTGLRNIIRGNNVSTSVLVGILGGSTARVEGNLVSFSGGNGIECADSCTITGNTLDTDPIVVTGDGNVIDSNDVLDVTTGFSVTLGGDDNRLSRNTLSANVLNSGVDNLSFTIRTAATFGAAGPWDNFRQN